MKKLYRMPNNKMIAGICSGFGEMFSIDPNIIRLIAVFACVLTGFFPIAAAYIVGVFIIPEKTENEEIQDNNIS